MKQEPRNNSFSRQSKNPPQPRDQATAGGNFGVVRTLDSHYFGRNDHFPDADQMPNLDEAGYDDVIDPSSDFD